MTEITKPADLSVVWASAGDILNPGNTKYQTGWQVEIPPRQWENFIQNKQDQAIAHINQHGLAVWDSATEYQASKSYTQGVTTGAVYRCKVTNAGQDPEADVTNTYWELAFASPGDFYTKIVADATFVAKAQNLADLTNTATARTNLSVYSKAETYTKTEVDGKTTVASTLQAQDRTSNTTLLTPLRLDESFKGANQSLVMNGYQKIPGGLIFQWGIATGSGNGTTVTFPTAFPVQCFGVVATCSTTTLTLDGAETSSFTTTNFLLGTASSGSGAINGVCFWWAVGK